MPGSLIAKADLDAINAINARIASRSAPQDLNAGSRKKSKMGQIMAHLVRQIDAVHHANTAYLRVA